MELIQPKHGGGVEEGAHLVASVVKDVGAPVGVLSLPGVGILVGGGAVKVIEAELIPGEVGGTQSMMTPMPAWCIWSTKYIRSWGVPKRLVAAK